MEESLRRRREWDQCKALAQLTPDCSFIKRNQLSNCSSYTTHNTRRHTLCQQFTGQKKQHRADESSKGQKRQKLEGGWTLSGRVRYDSLDLQTTCLNILLHCPCLFQLFTETVTATKSFVKLQPRPVA
jgi:hypothetical protein